MVQCFSTLIRKDNIMIISDKKALYTLAIRAVVDEMKGRGFIPSINDCPSNEVVVMFKKYENTMPLEECFEPTIANYGLTGFTKPSDITKLKASEPFRFLHLVGKPFNKTVSLEMNLSDVSEIDEEGIKMRVKEWLDALLPEYTNLLKL